MNIRPLLRARKPSRRASGMRFGNIGHWIDKWCSRQGTPAFLLLEYAIPTDLLLQQMLMFFNLCNVLQYINQSPKWSELVSWANNALISSIVQKQLFPESRGDTKNVPFWGRDCSSRWGAGTKGKILICDFFVNFHQKVPRLPTLPAAILQIFLCLGQIGRKLGRTHVSRKTFQSWCSCCLPSTTATRLTNMRLAPSRSWSTPTLATGQLSWQSTSSCSSTTTTQGSRLKKKGFQILFKIDSLF